MSITTENLLSNEDYLLVEANTLGAPLNVYKLKPSYIRFIRRVGLFIFWFGVIVLDNIPSQHIALKNGISYERDFVDKKGRTMRIYAVQRT